MNKDIRFDSPLHNILLKQARDSHLRNVIPCGVLILAVSLISIGAQWAGLSIPDPTERTVYSALMGCLLCLLAGLIFFCRIEMTIDDLAENPGFSIDIEQADPDGNIKPNIWVYLGVDDEPKTDSERYAFHLSEATVFGERIKSSQAAAQQAKRTPPRKRTKA